MRALMRTGLFALVAIVALTAGVAAQDAGTVSGTFVGDRGGAYVTMDLDLPADTDVTLTVDQWPCMTGRAIGFNVWAADGLLARSHESGPCAQEATFSTGAGGPAILQVFNYLHGVGTWYSVSATGMTLPGAEAPMAEEVTAEMAEEPAVEEATVEEAMPAEEMAEEAAPVEEEAMAEDEVTEEAMPAEAPAGMPAIENATLLGNLGGGLMTYDLPVMDGETYTVEMTYGVPTGGTWTGIGFNVWGPGGWVAQSRAVDNENEAATFVADGDGVYTIQVFNYHHGLTIFYSLSVEEAE